MSTVFQEIPFDLAAVDRMEGWREHFAWPLPHDTIYRMALAVSGDFVRLVDEIDDPELQDLFILIGPVQLATLLSLLETALWIQHSEQAQLRFAGGPKAVYLLRGVMPPVNPDYTEPSHAHAPPLRNQTLRRFARMASWTPWHRMPGTVLAPNATAISHNSLLRAFAADGRARVGFRHADTILAQGKRRAAPPRRLAYDGLIERIGRIVVRRAGLDAPLVAKVMELFAEAARPLFDGAHGLLSAARAVPRLPKEIWAGTGGYRPARALRIEARRRGAVVTGFDHSGSSGFIRETEGLAITEFAVSDRFYATTPRMAEIIRDSGAAKLLGDGADVIGAQGDPAFAAPPARPWRGPHSPPRVLYVSGAYIGYRQRFPSRIPDVLKLDWQLRLAETLKGMPIELLAQMHPGGLMRGKTHPVGTVATLSNRNFESVADWADVFLFDVVQSTTFTLALCTDRPIVLIDHGMNRFGDAIMGMLQRRCTILKVTHDDRNLPQIDAAALEDAICGSLERADPIECRALFAGEFA